MPSKRYLGDSVYVEVENGMLKLTTDNGNGPTNTIWLEPIVFDALVEYMNQAIEEAATSRRGLYEEG